MEKLFAGAAAAVMLSVAAPAWAAAPDAAQLPQTFEAPAEAVTARAHLVFRTDADPPLVGDETVIQQGSDSALVKTSFTRSDPASAVLSCPPARTKSASSKKTEG